MTINPENKVFLHQGMNYAKCTNDHQIHIDPCLKNWLLHSNKCPVCNTQYSDLVLAELESFIRDTKEREEKKKEGEQIEVIADQIATQLREKEEQSLIIEKINNAKKLIKKQKHVDALTLLFDIIDNDDPSNLEARFLIGKIRFLDGRFDLAVSNFMKLVKMEYDFPLAFYYLGKSYENLGLMDRVNWAYERSYKNLQKMIENPEIPENKKAQYKIILEEVSAVLNNR